MKSDITDKEGGATSSRRLLSKQNADAFRSNYDNLVVYTELQIYTQQKCLIKVTLKLNIDTILLSNLTS